MKKFIVISTMVTLLFAIGCMPPPPPPSFTVGGSISGLTGTISLTNTDTGESIDVSAETFSFAAQADDTPYTVTVSGQPAGQTCSVSNGNGTVSGTAVTDVLVECVTDWLGTQQLGSDAADSVHGMTAAADGSTVLVGQSYDATDSRQEGALWKREASGAASWSLLDDHRSGLLYDVITDAAGNVYAIGRSGARAYVIKVSAVGVLEWQVALGEGSSVPGGILLGSDGNLYVSGYTYDLTFEGQTNSGSSDVFVTQISTTGAVGWTTLLGDANTQNNYGGIAETPAGDLVVVYENYSYAVYHEIDMAKLDVSTGIVLPDWPVVILDSYNDVPWGKIAVDEQGDIYVGGYTASTLLFGETGSGSYDAFIMKVSGADGSLLWGHLLGSLDKDYGYAGVALDAGGNVVLAGRTDGTLPGQLTAGVQDIFVAKWDPNGTALWSTQIGSAQWDTAYALCIEPQGQILLGGYTEGDLDGNVNLGSSDGFLMKLDSATGDIVPATTP